MTFTDSDITWNGNVSTDWSDAGNWTGGVPGASDKAIIPAGRPLYPILTGNKKSVGSLQIDSGASVTVSSDLDISSNSSPPDSVVISGTLDWTSGAMTLSGSNVSLTVDSGGVFKLRSGTNGFPAFPTISLNANSTVEYGGDNQTVKVDSFLTTYGHLKTSGTGTKTWSGNTSATINGNLDVGGASTLTLGGTITVIGNLSTAAGATLGVSSSNWNITLKGNWTNNGTFAQGGSGATVTLNSSTAQQTIGGAHTTTFTNLLISNTSGSGIRLSQNVTVNAGLSLSNGIVDAATDGTTLTVNISVSGGNDSSYVSGKLARPYAAAASKAFPIGKGGFYRPVTIAITQLNGNSTLTAEQFETNIPGGSIPGTSLLGPRYWHVTQDGAFGNQIYYTITLDGRGLITPTKQVKIIKRAGGTVEVYNADGSGPTYSKTIGEIAGLTSFGDFALAQVANPTTLTVTSATGTYGGSVNLSATLLSGGPPGFPVGTALSGKTISFSLNGPVLASAQTNLSGVASVSGVSLAGIDAGTYSTGVSASFAGDDNWDLSSASNILTVNRAPATITLIAPSPWPTYDGTAKSATATTSPTGLAVSFTYNGSPAPPTNAGTYAVIASMANPNYDAPNAIGTLVILKATPAITWSNPA